MTDHSEISRRLALAIGHAGNDMRMHRGHLYVRDYSIGLGRLAWSDDPPLLPWRRFDYRDPLVIWPIAERYRCFPRNWRDGMWVSHTTVASTPAEAVALAVIGGAR